MKPTYEELAALVKQLGSDDFDWYSPDNTTVTEAYNLAERLEQDS